jgi:hypothetical protein
VLWSGIDLAFTWGKLLRCRDEDDERRLVHAWLSVAVPRQQVRQRQPAERLQLGVAKLGCRRLPLARFRHGKTAAGRPNFGDSTRVYMGVLP